MRSKALGLALLLLLIAAVFGPTVTHPFVNLDDPAYLLENPTVQRGLTSSSLAWAFTTFHASNWHPLTWLSHMLDVELFGLKPAGHHLVNVLLHGAAAATLFLVLTALTAAPWPSLWAALCFAIHPLRVESVAWVAERKDVLAALLWMLGLSAYLQYVRKPGTGRWSALLFVFALGLTAKPILVTLPVVLLLLDFWPLGRMRGRAIPGRLLLEKLPLLALSALSGLLTVKAQGVSVIPLEVIAPGERLANAAVAAVTYLGKTLWPSPLAVYYPRTPGGPALLATIAAALLLLSASAAAIRTARQRPYLAVGWGWYLVTVLPVLGLIQVGEQALADRYTYIPSVGCSVAAIWLLRDLSRRRRALRSALVGAGLLLILGWSMAAARYVQVWGDGVSLFKHALQVTRGNWLVHIALGGELDRRGLIDASVEQFRRAVAIRPDYAEAHFNLALSYEARGDAVRAAAGYLEALRLNPDHVEAHNNLGAIYARAGDYGPAIDHFRSSIRARPDLAEARKNLEEALSRTPR